MDTFNFTSYWNGQLWLLKKKSKEKVFITLIQLLQHVVKLVVFLDLFYTKRLNNVNCNLK